MLSADVSSDTMYLSVCLFALFPNTPVGGKNASSRSGKTVTFGKGFTSSERPCPLQERELLPRPSVFMGQSPSLPPLNNLSQGASNQACARFK